MQIEPISRQEFLASIMRAFLRSPLTRFFIAVAVVALSFGAAYVCWQARDIIVALLAVALVILGLRFAWELLPFSEQTRSRWTHNRELAERYPSYRWRNALWVGLAMTAIRLWDLYLRQQFDLWQLALPAVFIVIGAVSTVIWHTRHQQNG
jgi:uncharacterized membrane protein YfcA